MAATDAAEGLGLALRALHVGSAVLFPAQRTFTDSFDVGEGGASLVRPDGIVAWRMTDRPPDPVHVLKTVMAQVAALTS